MGFVAGEIHPQRNVPRSIILGVCIVIAIYVSANLAYYFVLGQAQIAASPRVAAGAMSAMIGPIGATLITLTILCSTFGAISANILAGPPQFLRWRRTARSSVTGKLHPTTGTPVNAIWVCAVWASVLTL